MSAESMISPQTLQALCQSGKRVSIIDIRDPAEYAREHIPNAHSIPLSQLSPATVSNCKEADHVVVHCLGGVRTCQAAPLLKEVLPNCLILEGGLNAWKKAGGIVSVNRKIPMSIDRQVFVIVGFLLLIALALAWCVSPWFNLLIIFFAVALIFSGITGFCAMAKLLKNFPYNQPKQ
jgi:rhodanese-related sulfurtransferase